MASESDSEPSAESKLTLWQKLRVLFSLIPLPVAVFWNVLTTAYASHNKDRPLRRIIGDATLRYVAGLDITPAQVQALFPTDAKMYRAWTKQTRLPHTVDELGDDARLNWIGEKRTERVVLFLHGGAFVLPATDYSLFFWRYVQLELEKKDIQVGFVWLEYTLTPQAVFPSQLTQARLALNFLLESGVQPSNLQIVGDSAGANLILQVLSQVLHPLPSVPRVSLPSPIRGALLISPWVSLTASSPSNFANDGKDYLPRLTTLVMGTLTLAHVPADQRVFAEAVRAPADWFSGAKRVFERVLITAGSAELLWDDIMAFAEAFKKQHRRAELVVQPNGLHEDMFLDFMVGAKPGVLTPAIVEWLAAGFSS
uniref:Alpha/beta hydrolase fold protein n=1 Tax=Mycena chlorophos TaxID=658473 RepID=A0ABQ0M5Z3_MYCCL|nr:alpha/beta hydrolase fold protein [Mycena chlorophos]